MAKRNESRPKVRDETTELKNRLEETEETLRAIRQYMVDAFVVSRSEDAQVVTLSGADLPYRMMVEAMNEGAVTMIPDGTIFYCNPRFSSMVKVESKRLIGVLFRDLVIPEERPQFQELLKKSGRESSRGEFWLETPQAGRVAVQISMYRLGDEETSGISIIVTDITDHIQSKEKIRSLASELTIAEQEERHRISQILHDDLQQRLFAVKAQLSFLRLNEVSSPETQMILDQLQTWLGEAITLTRNLSIDMSPSVLRGEGLAEAILWLAARMKEQHGLQLKIEAHDQLNQLDNHMRVLLFQAARELLFNVVKHSGTNEATVSIEHTDGQGRITVSDAGKGFDATILASDPASVHGLLLIKDRLSLMSGTMTIHSVPGDGTRVVIEFPLEERLNR